MFGLTRAPEIDRQGLAWFNTDRPLTLADLKGRLVILDFWTFCCINCMHALPALRRIEETFPHEVAVIGVHSPKFAAEHESANVAKAIARYDIRHPICHDPHMTLWGEYAVRAWPTLVFISPDGQVIGQLPGEPDPDMLLSGVAEMLKDFRNKNTLRPQPGSLLAESKDGASSPLRFPGKIKACPTSTRPKQWAVADSGHHRIVLIDDAGKETASFGTGVAGLKDGTQPQFNSPQGLIAAGDALFVADTGNHAVRRIDLKTGAVMTLAGRARRGGAIAHPISAETALLASPWDLEILGERLFIANAGTHQILEMDIKSGEIRRLAGNGGEGISDGPGELALLAQPSGLALSADKNLLYFADSETSAVRSVGLTDQPAHVVTLIGTGLFDFGDTDGAFAEAELQHPLGLAVGPASLALADSYNGRIKILDIAQRRISGLGDDFLCADPVCLPLGEPAGIVWDGADRLLIADTNNHRILEYRLPEKRSRSLIG